MCCPRCGEDRLIESVPTAAIYRCLTCTKTWPAVPSRDVPDPRRPAWTDRELARRCDDLEASLRRAQAAEAEQRRRAELAEESARRSWRLSSPATSGRAGAMTNRDDVGTRQAGV